MKRIGLFLMTNLAIIVVLSITLRLLGVERILDEQGASLDLNNLLVFASVFGFGGAFISLAMSKWIAKRSTGARVITSITCWPSCSLSFCARMRATVSGVLPAEEGAISVIGRDGQACASAAAGNSEGISMANKAERQYVRMGGSFIAGLILQEKGIAGR